MVTFTSVNPVCCIGFLLCDRSSDQPLVLRSVPALLVMRQPSPAQVQQQHGPLILPSARVDPLTLRTIAGTQQGEALITVLLQAAVVVFLRTSWPEHGVCIWGSLEPFELRALGDMCTAADAPEGRTLRISCGY